MREFLVIFKGDADVYVAANTEEEAITEARERLAALNVNESVQFYVSKTHVHEL